jgi:peptidoglycan hydrolase-like protein with peptidoglycan-binding domain
MIDIRAIVCATSQKNSDDVRIVQQLLNRAGALTDARQPLKVDGNAGPRTIAAIRDFHEAHLGSARDVVQPGTTAIRTLNEIADEFQILVATVFGEAAASSDVAQKAILWVMKNRVGSREWARFTSIASVIKNTGFDAYTQKNVPYVKAFNYMTTRSADTMDTRLERLIRTLRPVYRSSEQDSTSRAVLYYSPRAQAALHKKNPRLYAETPKWNFSVVQEVSIAGLRATDDFKFYRYK